MFDNIEGLDVDDEDTNECKSMDSSSDADVAGRTKHKKYPSFNEDTDFDNPVFSLGMEFKTHKLFRDAVKEYAIKWGKEIKFTLSDRNKVRAVSGWIGNDAVSPTICEHDPYIHVYGRETNHLLLSS
ncbi:hypothetical protein Dimus_011651 [Dionaea muscipula]